MQVMMSHSDQLLFKNGVLLPPADTPPLATLLQTHPGAYTTTRTHHNGAGILFWKRHVGRLSNSVKLLLSENPRFLFKPRESKIPFDNLLAKSLTWDSLISGLVNDYVGKSLPCVAKERSFKDEMSITTLVSGNLDLVKDGEDLDEEGVSTAFEVYLHFGGYVPRLFGIEGSAARLAVVGRGRDVGNAKYSDWVRLREKLEKLRTPSVSELLLSNDGDHILEGCLTNFFVVCRKDEIVDVSGQRDSGSTKDVEVQTAPLTDGVLPGVIRKVIVDQYIAENFPLSNKFDTLAAYVQKMEYHLKKLRYHGHREKCGYKHSSRLEADRTCRDNCRPKFVANAGIEILARSGVGGERVWGRSWEDHINHPEGGDEEGRY